MDRKVKSILKIAVPVAIMVQLTAIIFLLARMNKDKAFNCYDITTIYHQSSSISICCTGQGGAVL